jgi:hypothetical protein
MIYVRKSAGLQQRSLEACEIWLRNVPWELFCTFTFSRQVSDPQAVRIFRDFVDRLEKSLGGPVGLIRGDEKRYSGCGMPGAPRHFHALLAAHCKLDRHFVADLWMSMAGRRENGAGADVRIYDPKLGGLAYTLKFIHQPLGDWDFRNLDLFLTPSEQQHMSSRQRRRLARQAHRISSGVHGWPPANELLRKHKIVHKTVDV